jgi:hypothetical protein
MTHKADHQKDDTNEKSNKLGQQRKALQCVTLCSRLSAEYDQPQKKKKRQQVGQRHLRQELELQQDHQCRFDVHLSHH